MSLGWIIFIVWAVTCLVVAGLERRQDRRHDALEEKINKLQDTLDRKFNIDRDNENIKKILNRE